MAGRTELEQLVYTISADVSGLKRQLDRAVADTGAASGRIQKNLDKASNDNWSKRLGKSLDDTFGEARQRTISAGTAKLGLFGAALDGLGGAGILAAAGVAAVAVAYGQAKKAMDLSDEISDSAAQLGIGTTALQEYRYAARLAGADIKDADAAIAGFSKQVGLAANGNAKALKAFAALKIDPTQFKTVEDGLDSVADAIAALDKETDRQAFASKLGLEPLLPLLRNGAAGISNLREEAHKYGLVISEDVIAKAGEAKDKLETMSQVIETQLAVAFADLAPYIADAAEALADFIRQTAAFVNSPQFKQAAAFASGATSGFAKGGFIGAARGVGKALDQQAKYPFFTPEEYRAGLEAGIPVPPLKPAGAGSPGGLGAGGGSRKKKTPSGRTIDFADRELKTVDLKTVFDSATSLASDPKDPLNLSGSLDDFVEKFDQAWKERQQSVRDGLASSIGEGLEAGFKGGLPGILDYLAQELQRALVSDVSKGLAGFLTGGGAGGGVASILGSLFGGGRAAAGSAQRGKFYRINENTPNSEYFAPGVSGAIVTADAVRNAMGLSSRMQGQAPRVNVPLHIHAEGAVLAAEFLDRAKSFAVGVGQATYGRAMQDSARAVPGIAGRFDALGTV